MLISDHPGCKLVPGDVVAALVAKAHWAGTLDLHCPLLLLATDIQVHNVQHTQTLHTARQIHYWV